MKFGYDFLNELKMRNDIESVISSYVNLKRRGSNLIGSCPFHNEKTPSFTIWPDKGSYYCFGCGAGGDVITFMMQIERLDYVEAVKVLAERVGMQLPVDGEEDKLSKLKSRIYDANRAAAKFYYERLISPEGKEALSYLTGRGLQPKTIKQFGLGYAPDEWDALVKHLKSLGFTDYELKQANLVSETKKGSLIDRYRNRVMFPVIDLRGNFIAFSGRKLREDDYGGKYINTSDTPVYKKSANMFALNFAKNHCAERVILVEGNMDVISLHQAGFNMAVAALGTAFTADQARLLARYSDEVIVTMDADSAGAKSTDKVLKILAEAGVKARILRLPDCKDPDDYIKKYGATRFKALLDGAVSDIEYKLHVASEGIDMTLSDGKIEYLKKAVAILATLHDDISKELYAGKLSELCGVSKETILSATEKEAARQRKVTVKKELNDIVKVTPSRDAVNPEKALYPRAVAAEEHLISILISHPDLYEDIKDEISADGFVTEFSKKLFEVVLETLSEKKSFELSVLGSDFSPKEIGYVSMLQNTMQTGNDPKRVATESIEVIKQEKKAKNSKNLSEMTTDEWAERMKSLADGKINKG
ncbi:MAG: DNA primase [Clostridia bacterium]|nr:DNA primase [Clostridia bacterium]